MDIKGIGNDLTSLYTSTAASDASETKFKDIFDKALAQKDDAELKDACNQFEAYFVQQLFQEMRKTVPKGGLFEDSNEKGIYDNMLDEQYSKAISERGAAGISSALYKQLSPKIAKVDPVAVAEPADSTDSQEPVTVPAASQAEDIK